MRGPARYKIYYHEVPLRLQYACEVLDGCEAFAKLKGSEKQLSLSLSPPPHRPKDL
jgi:hypothetical protein